MAIDRERDLLTLGRYAGELEGICGGERRKEEKRNREIGHANKKTK